MMPRQVSLSGLKGEFFMFDVWGSMVYRCESCGNEKRMYLEVGVEGPGKQNEMPCPFCIRCPECNKLDMTHVDWVKDEAFTPRRIQKSESYFRLDRNAGCGRAVHQSNKA